MTARGSARAERVRDYRVNRPDWAALANGALEALARPDEPHATLGQRGAGAAHGMWVWAAPYPEGLMCQTLAVATHAWCRLGPDARAALGPALKIHAETVLALIAAADAFDARVAALATLAAEAPRLPFRADIDG